MTSVDPSAARGDAKAGLALLDRLDTAFRKD